MSRKPNSSAGFTLIEVLVTLSLVSVMFLIVGSSAAQFRSLIQATRQEQTDSELAAAADFIAEQLTYALRLPLTGAENASRVTMRGTENSISFVGLAHVGSDRIALRDISIGNTDSGISYFSARKQEENFPPPDEQSILTNATIHFQFLSAGTRGKGNQFELNELPPFMKFQLKTVRNKKEYTKDRLVIFKNSRNSS